MKAFSTKLILAILCALAIISYVSGDKPNLRGMKERTLSSKGGKGSNSSKSPSSKGKGGKGEKSSKSPSSKGKGGKGKNKSSKSPGSKGKGSKGKNKSSKSPGSKGKGGKGKKSSKSPSSKGKGGKGGKGKKSSKSPGSKGKGGKGGKGNKSSKTPTLSPIIQTPGPTNICRLTDDERIDQIERIISQVSDINDVREAGTPQNLSYRWLISEGPDSLFVCPDNVDFVLQRYILGVTYFALDGDNWDRCQSNTDSADCFAVVDGETNDYEPYLSKEDVCEWFGITCNGNNIVTGVFLGGDVFFVGVNGVLPNELFSLPRVQFINFDGSKDRSDLRRIRGSIPAAIGNAKFLRTLDLDRNRISGEIPEEIFELTSLQLLDLDNNFLTGTISPSFENLQELSFMTIGNNLFEGQPMPEAFATLPNLAQIGLQRSNLTGKIPESYADLENVGALDISFNDLEGDLSVFSNYTNTISFSVNNNKFDGFVPGVIWDNEDMRVIDIANNNLEGELPASVGDMSELVTLKMDNNNFSGLIPEELGEIETLRTLTLENNNFDVGATVPKKLCKIDGIEITIDQGIDCPGKCCTVVPRN